MKILIVEDEKMISDAVCKILEDAGFYTDAVYDGEDALYYIKEAKYDLIILDIMLPLIDGTEILKRVRAMGNNTPILMLTAKNTIPDKVLGLNSGADDYMTKPFDADELLARVGALTRRTGNVIIGKLDFGDLSLDLNTAILSCGENSIQLTKKEFSVLKMLLANSNMTLTKENLIVNIWGEDSDTTENNVEAYISFIRKKIRYLNLEIAQKIYAQKNDFGVLKSENLYYYKQSTPNELKISVASRNFILFSMLELFGVLMLIFILAMLIFYFISKKLANRAAKPLEDAITREKQFITDASHDLKTPLTVILSNADILSRNQTCSVSEMLKWIDGTKQAAGNMKELIEQMLVLSESETKTEIKKEDVNISDIAEKNALVMESVAYEKNIDYMTEIQPNIIIKGNADYVKRIVISLIDNAIKYETDGGSICVSLNQSKKNVYFSVRNKSSVISKEDISHIFERFYRTDKSRHADGSHGLGLAIVKNLTELMNGKIEVSSNEKDGTTFTVTLQK